MFDVRDRAGRRAVRERKREIPPCLNHAPFREGRFLPCIMEPGSPQGHPHNPSHVGQRFDSRIQERTQARYPSQVAMKAQPHVAARRRIAEIDTS
jgi:hypothetical protein